MKQGILIKFHFASPNCTNDIPMTWASLENDAPKNSARGPKGQGQNWTSREGVTFQ